MHKVIFSKICFKSKIKSFSYQPIKLVVYICNQKTKKVVYIFKDTLNYLYRNLKYEIDL